MKKTILSCEGLYRSFGSTIAVDDVSLTVNEGQIIGLVGENGAGKTTLIKLLVGEHRPERGKIVYQGREVHWANSNQALRSGIGIVHQHPLLVPELTASANIFLGQEYSNYGLVNDGRAVEETQKLLAEYQIFPNLDLNKKVSEMSAGEQEVVEILKVLSYRPKVLILDEPTASLPRKETEALIAMLKQLNTVRSLSIIYISHKLEEVFDVSHRIVVLRNGKRVGVLEKEQFHKDEVVKLMINDEITAFYPEKATELGSPILELEGLTAKKIHNVSLNVRAGEIVGLYGLMGAGMTEVVESIFGLRPFEKGSITFQGKAVGRPEVSSMIERGVYLIPSDRHRLSIFNSFTIRENITVAHLRALFPETLLNPKKERQVAESKAGQMGIKMQSVEQQMSELSGGNQQKVVVTRWLLKDCKLLIVDDPTVGIDVGAKHDIYLILRELNRAGVGVVLISSEISEILGMADRVYTMYDGAITAELTGDQITQENILKNIL